MIDPRIISIHFFLTRIFDLDIDLEEIKIGTDTPIGWLKADTGRILYYPNSKRPNFYLSFRGAACYIHINLLTTDNNKVAFSTEDNNPSTCIGFLWTDQEFEVLDVSCLIAQIISKIRAVNPLHWTEHYL